MKVMVQLFFQCNCSDYFQSIRYLLKSINHNFLSETLILLSGCSAIPQGFAFACYLVLSVQSTPLLNQGCYNIGVPYNSSPVQCCLITLQKEDLSSVPFPPHFDSVQMCTIHKGCIFNTCLNPSCLENSPRKQLSLKFPRLIKLLKVSKSYEATA